MSSIDDLQFLARALRLAERGRYSVHPNPMVGCVLVRQGEIVGEGYHVRAGYHHAEAAALVAAGDRAQGATAYVTLEPCSFHGRTPSCARALCDAGVARVVVATIDPDKRNAGKGLQILKDAGIEVVHPVLEASARHLIRGHCRRLVDGRPFVRLKLAMSLDGGTALANGESKWITSPAARRDVQKLRAMSAAIVTGVQTVIDDDPRLDVRSKELGTVHAKEAAEVSRPVYVLDSRFRIPSGSRLLQRPETVVVGASEPPADFEGTALVMPGPDGQVDLLDLLEELARREHSDVLFECGPTLAGSLVSQHLVDELVIYIAPSLMGSEARSLLNLPNVDRMTDLKSLVVSDVRQVGRDFRVTAQLSTARP